jgi:hypothetical protein
MKIARGETPGQHPTRIPAVLYGRREISNIGLTSLSHSTTSVNWAKEMLG